MSFEDINALLRQTMPKKKVQFDNKQACAWMIAIPMRAEFTQPMFHFGERVKWLITPNASRFWLSGRVMGLWFSQGSESWEYLIKLDPTQSLSGIELDETAIVEEIDLKLVNDSHAIRNSLVPVRRMATILAIKYHKS